MQALLPSIKKLPPSAHVCGFYDDRVQRLDLIADYYRVGLERNELCIFITDQKPSSFIKDLKKRDLDIDDAIQNGDFKLFAINPTYLPDGEFHHSEMLNNLRDFVKQAMKDNYSGVRGGGDMRWLKYKVPGKQDVGEYEAKINRFIRNNNFTGLCLFPSSLKNLQITKDIIQTHQYLIHGDKLYPNPFYVPPEKFFKFEINIVAQLENWLDAMDEQRAQVPV
jgi:hypothetical protein